MNVKSTLGLLALVALGAGLFAFGPDLAVRLKLAAPPEAAPESESARALAALAPDKITRVEVRAGGEPVVLEKAGTTWVAPDKWPLRQAEAKEVVDALGSLSTRFRPVALAGDDRLKDYGLDPEQKPVAVKLTAGDAAYALTVGSPPPKPGENPFTVPTYVRVDDKPEAVRLAPGLLPLLRRPKAYYQKRQLFPSLERVKVAAAGPDDPATNLDLPVAKSVTLRGPGGTVTLERSGPVAADDKADDASAPTVTNEQIARAWSITAPSADRADPDKLRPALAAVPDVWAEQFLDAGKKTPAETGLDKPEYEVSVTPPAGPAVKLLVGKVSRTVERTPPAPPQANPFAPPPPPPTPVKEEYRYARLDAPNSPLFEVKADKFKDLFAPLGELRDARLARFKAADVVGVTLEPDAGEAIELTKDTADGQERWSLKRPVAGPAEAARVSELVEKLADLQARDKDVLDKKPDELKGLELAPKPKLKVTLAVKEEVTPKKGDTPAVTKDRTVVFSFGRRDADKAKVYAQVAGVARVNAVDDAFLKLAERPALAYRGRRVLDFTPSQVAEVTVKQGGDALKFTQPKPGDWTLAEPPAGGADREKIGRLVDDLSRLEAAEFVGESPKADELAKYGLAKPAATVTVTLADKAKKPQTLEVGGPREGKPEVYARVAGATQVFALKKETADKLAEKAVAYLPPQAWTVKADDLTAVRVERAGGPWTLLKDGAGWRLSGPFDAPVTGLAAQPLVDAVAAPKAEKYEALAPKDLVAFGLDKPEVTVRLTATEKAEPKPDAKPGDKPAERTVERVLLLGKPTAAGAATRFAKAADAQAVFVAAEQLVSAVTADPLTLPERQLAAVRPEAVEKVAVTGPGGAVTLTRKGDGWQADGKPPFAADAETVGSLLKAFDPLAAVRLAAYGPKANPAEFGLDKPSATVTLTLKAEGGKPAETRVLAVGKPVEKTEDGPRFARLEGGPAVAVLGPAAVRVLTRGPLEFADRTLLSVPAFDVVGVKRDKPELELARKDDVWALVKPAGKADNLGTDELTEQLARLRAKRVAAVAPGDLKPFGLDKPAATVTLELTAPDGKKSTKAIKLGGEAKGPKDAAGDRFAAVDGSATVGVLPAELANKLLAEPLKFRDRLVARFNDADRVVVRRGERTATFARADGTWKMTAPVPADAEANDLDELVNGLARLRAAELVAEKPADLKPYGLDKPEADLQVFLGDKEVMRLEVGAKEKGGPRAYARLAKGDVVFLLDPAATGRALAEYRKRSVVPAFDASQVSVLTINRASREDTVVLKKENGTWQPDKKDRTANVDAVNELLATLAGLKAERFAADKADAKDLKLYGLDPEQALIVAVAGGKTVIVKLGNAVGDTKARYARVQEPGRDDVFVVGEEDAKKLDRGLPQLTAPAKKGA